MAHMSMWVMAASPLLTTVDVRNMTAEVKAILTNADVLVRILPLLGLWSGVSFNRSTTLS